jgi:N-acetylmuramoyl-L-alanine amidase
LPTNDWPISRPSPNFDARTRPISLIVLHYTGMASLTAALDRLTDPAPIAGRYPGPWQADDAPKEQPLGRVSAHYVVGEAGEIYALVDEAQRAWHAGVSHWAGVEGVNDISIGIEIANGGHDFGLPAFPERQIDAVCALLSQIMARHRLGPHAVVGHSDVAPGRKLDPGERFPWPRLAAGGLALAPLQPAAKDHRPVAQLGDEGIAVLAIQETLAAIGYGLTQSGQFDQHTQQVVAAFQRRFRPEQIDGAVDQHTAALMADIAGQTARLRLSRLQS